MDKLGGDAHALAGALYRSLTIPSTFSSRAISGSDFLVCLYCMEDVREMTLTEPICAGSLISASVIPSEKYS